MVSDFTLLENFMLVFQNNLTYQKQGRIQWRRLRQDLEKKLAEYDVRPPRTDEKLSRFSGGNQQKFVVARELHHQPDLLIVAQPTRGVDIGAIEQIHQRILELRNSGGAVLLISSELDELMKLSDRIVVMHEGHLSSPLLRSEFNERKIGAMMGGTVKTEISRSFYEA